MHFAEPTLRPRGLLQHELAHRGGVQPLELERACRRLPPVKEHARDPDIVAHGRPRQTTPLKQIRRISLDQLLDRPSPPAPSPRAARPPRCADTPATGPSPATSSSARASRQHAAPPSTRQHAPRSDRARPGRGRPATRSTSAINAICAAADRGRYPRRTNSARTPARTPPTAPTIPTRPAAHDPSPFSSDRKGRASIRPPSYAEESASQPQQPRAIPGRSA